MESLIDLINGWSIQYPGVSKKYTCKQGVLQFYKDPDLICLYYIEVAPALRRQGLCRGLIDHILEFVWQTRQFKGLAILGVQNADLDRFLTSYTYKKISFRVQNCDFIFIKKCQEQDL